MRKSVPKSYEYIEKLIPSETELMQQARLNSEKINLGMISITATEAQLIKFHLLSIQARKVLEIGTLTGLSALHILQCLPADGLLITLEKSVEHAELARQVLSFEVKKNRCQIVVGDAQEKLADLKSETPFDAIFIDGNKSAYLDYFKWAIENVRSGGMIFVDNVFLAGAVWGDETKQRFSAKQIETLQKMNQLAFSTSNLASMIIPTEEGLLISRKVC